MRALKSHLFFLYFKKQNFGVKKAIIHRKQSPLSFSAVRSPHPARGRKMTKAFFFELIKIKPEI
jgi:hypothetical protein